MIGSEQEVPVSVPDIDVQRDGALRLVGRKMLPNIGRPHRVTGEHQRDLQDRVPHQASITSRSREKIRDVLLGSNVTRHVVEIDAAAEGALFILEVPVLEHHPHENAELPRFGDDVGPVQSVNLRQQIHRISISDNACSVERLADQCIIDGPIQPPEQCESFPPIAAFKQIKGDLVRILRRKAAVEYPVQMVAQKGTAEKAEVAVQPRMLEILPEPHRETKAHLEGKADKNHVPHKVLEFASPQ